MKTSLEEWQDATFDVSDDYQDARVSGFVRSGFRVHEYCGVAHLVHVQSGVLFGLFDTKELAKFAGDLAMIGLEGNDFAAMGEEQRVDAYFQVTACWMSVGLAAVGSYDGQEAVWFSLCGPGGVAVPLGFGPMGPNYPAECTLESIDRLIEDLNAVRAEFIKASQQDTHA